MNLDLSYSIDYPIDNGKINIICDTNVIYNIARGEIDIDTFKNFNLCATLINVHELCTTYNIIHMPIFFRTLVKVLNEKFHLIIEHDPFDYLILNSVDDKYEPQKYTSYFNDLTGFLKYDLSKVVEDEENIKVFSNHSDELDENYNIKFNDLLKLPKVTTKPERQILKSVDIFNMGKELIKNTIIRRSDFDPKILNNISFTNHLLFLKIYEKFIRTLMTDLKYKLELNDIYDVNNLIYVLPGEKYLTFEPKWLEFAKQAKVYDEYFIPVIKGIIDIKNL